MKKQVELPLVEPIYSTYQNQGSGAAVIYENPSIRNWYLNEVMVLRCNKKFLQGFTSPDIHIDLFSWNENPHLEKQRYAFRFTKRHYILENEDGTITDDSGLGLYFTECDYSADCHQCHSLHDEKGNYLYFNMDGKLRQIVDANGNQCNLVYEDGLLVQVVDGNGKTARLEYNANNRLSRIYDTTGLAARAITYTYDAAGQLKTIQYPPQEGSAEVLTTTFSYNATTGDLTDITDQTGIKYTVHYASDGKVRQISQHGTLTVTPDGATAVSTEDGGSISFEYRDYSTAVRDDETLVKTVYRFDENGRVLSSYEDMTELSDVSMRSVSTRTQINGYKSILSKSDQSPKTGKYRSLSANIAVAENTVTNLLVNSEFSGDVGDVEVYGWTNKNIHSNRGRLSSESYLNGQKSYCMDGDIGFRWIQQEVDLCQCALEGNVLVASAWAKATNPVQSGSGSAHTKFRLYLKISYENGEVAEYAESFDPSCTGWQYAAIPFVVDPKNLPTMATCRLEFSGNTGECYFCNPRLVAVNGTVNTNRYNLDGTALKNATIFGENKEFFTSGTVYDGVLTTENFQDENNDTVMTKVSGWDGYGFTSYYAYDDKHNLVKTQDYRGMVTEYTYDDYGNQLTQKTYHKDDPNAYMYAEKTYAEGHLLTSERDPRYEVNCEELKTRYEYNTTLGLMTKRTETNGQEYRYDYDDNTDDLRTLSSTVGTQTSENKFHYKNGYLTKVEHNGFHFGFSYDALGRSSKVSVGNTALLTKTFETGVTDTVTTTYATGEVTKVTTDLRGNPTLKTYTSSRGTETVSTASYDEVGNPQKLVDKLRGVCYDYTYNSDGNVIKVTERNANTFAAIRENRCTYDSDKRLSSQYYGATGHTYNPIYEKDSRGRIYPDSEVVGVQLSGVFTDRVTRDGLGRASVRTLTANGETLFREQYEYLSTSIAANKDIETSFVSAVTHNISDCDSTRLQYTYDAAGNIETVSRDWELLSKYYYDGLNRLVREDNHAEGKTWVWCYNVGGNITEKRVYNLTTDVNLGSSYTSIPYVYKTSGWKDQLVSYNGQQCVYDALGNPTTYRGHALTWSHVRRLDKYDNHTFSYGADGIRYKKNNTTYTLSGSKILKETNGTRTLTYYYGGSGVIGFRYDGTDYYYQKNLQGDVISIHDDCGNINMS